MTFLSEISQNATFAANCIFQMGLHGCTHAAGSQRRTFGDLALFTLAGACLIYSGCKSQNVSRFVVGTSCLTIVVSVSMNLFNKIVHFSTPAPTCPLFPANITAY